MQASFSAKKDFAHDNLFSHEKSLPSVHLRMEQLSNTQLKTALRFVRSKEYEAKYEHIQWLQEVQNDYLKESVRVFYMFILDFKFNTISTHTDYVCSLLVTWPSI